MGTMGGTMQAMRAGETDERGESAASLRPLPLFGHGETRPEALVEVAKQFDVEGLVDQVLTACLSVVFTEQRQDQAFQERLRASVTQNAYALRDVIAGTTPIAEVQLDHVLSFASVQARLRIPQKSMQRSYRVSFYVQWHLWSTAMRDHVVLHDLGRDAALNALERLTQTVLGYQDHVASLVAETYTRDFEELNRSRAHVRRRLVQDVLRGREERLSATDLAILAYPLEHQHVAVLLPGLAEGAADRVAEGLRVAGRSHQTLVYPVSLTSTVIWLARIEPWHARALDAVVAHLDKLGVTATVSMPLDGIDGFRAVLVQARDADRVREAWRAQDAASTPQVVRYADAGLEILLLQNDDLARSFVESELGELAADTSEAARLRDTLEASFRFGSHVAAAEHLQLHEHTVRNRLHRAEELLGHPLSERRTELQVAVRLVRLLGGQSVPDQPDDSPTEVG
jgi:DNA-binding PucR family transcriptional regulator